MQRPDYGISLTLSPPAFYAPFRNDEGPHGVLDLLFWPLTQVPPKITRFDMFP